jgi:hypothetical protein
VPLTNNKKSSTPAGSERTGRCTVGFTHGYSSGSPAGFTNYSRLISWKVKCTHEYSGCRTDTDCSWQARLIASVIKAMRNYLRCLLVFLVTCTFDGSLKAAETRDLILVAGQSNAVGYDAKPSALPADTADQKIMFWWRCGDPPPDEFDSTSGGKWLPLQAQPRGNPKVPRQGRQYGNFAQAEGGFGPEIGFARALYAKEHQRFAIVKAAFSGTGMAQDWNPADPGEGGSCYRALISETKAAIAAAKSQGITLRLRALIWVQGESDANAELAPRYEKALGDMITALRQDLGAPELIALLAVNTHFGNDQNPFVPKIVEAQQALAGKDVRCAYVDTATATIANSAHYDTAGTLDVGRRFAEALLKFKAKPKASARDAK